MAVVSESMFYQERIAPASYVSSSGYYGYVPPPCPFVNYESVVVKEPPCNSGANEAINGTSIIPAPANTGDAHWPIPRPASLFFQNHNNNPHDTTRKYSNAAMETDQDEAPLRTTDHDGVSQRQNNHCVIPEPRIQNINNATMFSLPFGPPHGSAQSKLSDFTKSRGNRKRNSAGDPAYLIGDSSADFTKKSRQGIDHAIQIYSHPVPIFLPLIPWLCAIHCNIELALTINYYTSPIVNNYFQLYNHRLQKNQHNQSGSLFLLRKSKQSFAISHFNSELQSPLTQISASMPSKLFALLNKITGKWSTL